MTPPDGHGRVDPVSVGQRVVGDHVPAVPGHISLIITIMMLDNEQMNTLPLEFVVQELVRQCELNTKQQEVQKLTWLEKL